MASCQATTKTGQPCPNNAPTGGGFCFTHDPDRAAERKIAGSKGGAARQGRSIGLAAEHTGPILVKSTSDIVQLLERTINDALGLENSLNRARVVGYLALAACK